MRAISALTIVGLWAAAEQALADEPIPPRPMVISRPDWISTPDMNALSSAFPDKAVRDGVGGMARMQCQVSVLGLLENCQIVSEAPVDYGFGAAALKLAPYFVMRPKMVDGEPVGGTFVTIPLRFSNAPAPAPPPAPLAKP